MAGMIGLARKAQQDEEQRRLAEIENASLKKHIRDTPPLSGALGTADRMDLVGKSFNVWDMMMNGISIAHVVHDALTLTQSMRLISELPKEAQAVNLASTGLKAGRMMFAVEALGPLASYVSFWIDLAGAWAEAKARVFADNAMRGFSAGAVLGANGASPAFVGDSFWQKANGSYPAYRELDVPSKNIHNGALVAGYAQGKSLSNNQRRRLARFLTDRFSEGQKNFYFEPNPNTGKESNWDNWTLQTKKGFYSDLAGIFRRELLR